MGLFDKFKTIFQKEPEKVTKYEEGLEKTRKEFISQLSNLSNKYKFINDDYFEELENILIILIIY